MDHRNREAQFEAEAWARMPKEETIDVCDRFMDYVGNALNGLAGWIDHDSSDADRRAQKIRNHWQILFHRIEIFMKSGFVPTERITEESLGRLLMYRDRDSLAPEVFDELQETYESIIKR